MAGFLAIYGGLYHIPGARSAAGLGLFSHDGMSSQARVSSHATASGDVSVLSADCMGAAAEIKQWYVIRKWHALLCDAFSETLSAARTCHFESDLLCRPLPSSALVCATGCVGRLRPVTFVYCILYPPRLQPHQAGVVVNEGGHPATTGFPDPHVAHRRR